MAKGHAMYKGMASMVRHSIVSERMLLEGHEQTAGVAELPVVKTIHCARCGQNYPWNQVGSSYAWRASANSERRHLVGRCMRCTVRLGSVPADPDAPNAAGVLTGPDLKPKAGGENGNG